MLCFLQNPITWFVLQIKQLLSLWNAVLDCNGSRKDIHCIDNLRKGKCMRTRNIYILTLFRMDLFGAAHGWREIGDKKAPLSKIWQTYLTIMKLGTVISDLKEIQKKYESCSKLLDFCWHHHFAPKVSKLCYIKKYRCRLHFDI